MGEPQKPESTSRIVVGEPENQKTSRILVRQAQIQNSGEGQGAQNPKKICQKLQTNAGKGDLHSFMDVCTVFGGGGGEIHSFLALNSLMCTLLTVYFFLLGMEIQFYGCVQGRIQDFRQGAQQSFDPRGALSPEFTQNKEFSLKTA